MSAQVEAPTLSEYIYIYIFFSFYLVHLDTTYHHNSDMTVMVQLSEVEIHELRPKYLVEVMKD